MGETANSAVLASWLQAEDTESLWDNHALDLIVWGWDTLKDLKSLHGGGTTSSLVWDHTTDGLVKDAGWSAEMEWSTTGWVVAGHLAEVGMVLHCTANMLAVDSRVLQSRYIFEQTHAFAWPFLFCILFSQLPAPSSHSSVECVWVQRTLSAEELSRDVEGLAANDNNLLSLEELLSNGRGETTEEMALAIDGDLQYAPSASIFCALFVPIYFGILSSQCICFDRECRDIGYIGSEVRLTTCSKVDILSCF